MTYLECVNQVLKRLRENQVTTVDQTNYSALIGSFVNDAKREIEDAHQWSSLRETLTFPTVASQLTYSLTGCNQESCIIKEVIDDTNNTYLLQATERYLNDSLYIGSGQTGNPMYYIYSGTDASGNLKVDLYPKPSGIFQIRVDLVRSTVDLPSDSSVLRVPGNCVRDLAVAYALSERGESGGLTSSEARFKADQSLANAISIDANRYGKELVYEAV